MKYILENKTFYVLDKYVLSSCNTSDYDSIYIRLDSYWFEIKPESYILNQTYNGTIPDYQDLCTIGILPTSDNLITLGTIFLRNYYTIFDLEND